MLPYNSNTAIRAWMRRNVEFHRDPTTGEVNATAMVEAWDRDVSHGAETMDSNHQAWEIALEFR